MEEERGLWLPAGSAVCSCGSDIPCQLHDSHLAVTSASIMVYFGGISITLSLPSTSRTLVLLRCTVLLCPCQNSECCGLCWLGEAGDNRDRLLYCGLLFTRNVQRAISPGCKRN